MAREIEAKFRLPAPEALRARLHEVGATWVGAFSEVNRLFDTPNRQLLHADSGLRVRETRSEAECTVTLTYKGPSGPGPWKDREELGFEVADAEIAGRLLNRLGYQPFIVYEKRREVWRLGATEVALDELPKLGWFVEIEAQSGDEVSAAREQLGLGDQSPEAETYPHLTATHGTERDGCRVLAFAAT